MIGVSAGACHGCSYVSGQRGRSFRITDTYQHDPRYMGMRSLLTTGDLFNAKFTYHTIPEQLDPYDFKAFNETKTKLYAVCTNVESGEAEYFRMIRMEQDVEYVRASASLPLVSRIVEIDGKKLLDGGIADSIPIRKFQSMGYDRNIVVLTQCREYRKKKDPSLPLIRTRYRRYPAFVRKMEDRHTRYNETLEYLSEQEAAGNVLILQPKESVDISRIEKDLDKLRALYEKGYQDAVERIEDIRRFLSEPARS
ncbi:MAG: patatin family protein [Merdibacter sp.]